MRFRERTSKAWVLLGAAALVACASEETLPASRGDNAPQAAEKVTEKPAATPNAPEVARVTPVARPVLSPDVAERLKSSLGQRLTHSIDGLQRRAVPGIGDTVRADGRFQHVVIQARDATGRMHTECFENEAQLERSLGGGLAP